MKTPHPTRCALVLIATGLCLAASARGQTPTFADTLNPASETVSAGNSGAFSASSTIYNTDTITTTAGNYTGGVGGSQRGTSHTWTSLNDSYVPSGMTAPTSSDPLTSFGAVTTNSQSTVYSAKNSDGATGGKLLYTDFMDCQPLQTAGTIYGVQSVYLVSPLITFHNGSVVSFWTEGSVAQSGASGGDQLLLRLSTNSSNTFNIGGYTPTGSTTGSAGGQATYDGGDFARTLLDINPNQLADGTGTVSTGTSTANGSFPTTWTQYKVTISGLSTTANNPTGLVTGRFAIQYLETHANGDAADGFGDDVALDDFTVDVPEPSTWLGSALLLGAAGLSLGHRLRAC